MKKALLFAVFAIAAFALSAQERGGDVAVGDVLTIEEPAGTNYKYILFPRKNLIVKRGGIASYKDVINRKVEVVAVEYSKKGETIVRLKPMDGGKFFKAFPTIKARLEAAKEAGELVM